MASTMKKVLGLSKSSLGSMQAIQKVCSRSVKSTSMVQVDLSRFDPVQVELMKEMCIEVDENDKVIGPVSKKECHLMKNINKGMLHRAFSVFLFNTKGEFVLQQRSDEKITFPGRFTNTCCSHPLYIDSELEETNAIGVERAARRRLKIELGLDPESIKPDEILYLTRFKYTAPSDDEIWGENELGYLFFLQKDVELKPNPNEVKDYIYLSREQLKPFIDGAQKKGIKLTPWFKFIADNLLPQYWDNLDKLKELQDHKTIHKFN